MYHFKVIFLLWYIPRGGIAQSHGSSIFRFWGLSILFSIVVVSIYIPTNSIQRFLFLHILANFCFLCRFLWSSVWMVWCDISLWLLICISLMISDAEQLFMYLLAICMSSSSKKKCLSDIFVYPPPILLSDCDRVEVWVPTTKAIILQEYISIPTP